ncbi:hypothetical protein [Tenacibaculum finnmarkense]|uniref:hypothetical protein n=1 Tax=Tenacibaculum finnmarkense TaxID=2781243 RepID=UPI001EFB29AB|nr:hypothetical protein [Tenacibaculum finnmarkense]MCG8750532.1 hypothetical protein [Tenacibaculum finnmarkense]MCG8755500.1 hypothetical protein [Tenacibaculum finnmarkense]MCG8784115.1 hypothetical protein [Tenacibaculum finnmarkense]
MELVKKVKTELAKEHGIDFNSGFFTDEVSVFLEEIVDATENVLRDGKEVLFNINHQVKVKLTEYGYSVLVDYYNKYSVEKLNTESIIKIRKKADSEGYTSFQMHQLLNIFGSKLEMRNKICFDTNIIIVPE